MILPATVNVLLPLTNESASLTKNVPFTSTLTGAVTDPNTVNWNPAIVELSEL